MSFRIALLLLAGCTGCAGGETGGPARGPEPVPAEAPGAPGTPASADAGATPGAPAAGSAEPAGVRPSPYAAADAGSLPEVRVKEVGLHIGGGPNDADTKAPFQRSARRSFERFRDCYRFSEQGDAGGTYGVDLKIGSKGGHPEVRQPRTSMRGEQFRKCMVAAFESVDFEAPGKPTVISYSIKFSVGD